MTSLCCKDGGVGGGGGCVGPESCERRRQRPQEEPQHVSEAVGGVSLRSGAERSRVAPPRAEVLSGTAAAPAGLGLLPGDRAAAGRKV